MPVMKKLAALLLVAALKPSAAFSSFTPRINRAAVLRMIAKRDTQAQSAQEPAAESDLEKLYPNSWMADQPSEEPNVHCFLAPSWMEGRSGWVCFNRYEMSRIDAEDSY